MIFVDIHFVADSELPEIGCTLDGHRLFAGETVSHTLADVLRGPIDFDKRAAGLESIAHADSVQALHHLSENWRDGCVKLYLIWKAIRFRRDHADLFREGEFVPLQSAGANARNVAAFVRRRENSYALAAIPRWLSQVPARVPEQGAAKGAGKFDWGDTRLILPAHSPAEWNNILTHSELTSKNEAGEQHFMVNDLFQEFPVAFLSGPRN